MAARFTCQSEYQRSFGVSRSRSVSPQRGSVSSAVMGRKRRPDEGRRLGPAAAPPAAAAAAADSSGVWLRPPPPPRPRPAARSASPPAGRKGRPAAQPRPAPPPPSIQAPAEPGPPGAAQEAGRLRPPGPARQPPPSGPHTPTPSSLQVEAASSQAGPRPPPQTSGPRSTHYLTQPAWKKPPPAASPLLMAEQRLRSAGVRENPVSMATEYQRSFQGLAPPTGPRLRTQLEEQQRIPLFHILMQNNINKEEESERIRSEQATPPPDQTQHTHRSLEGGGASGAPQAVALRQQAAAYRRRAWGTNFCRQHLSQLRSQHNALWEPGRSRSHSHSHSHSHSSASQAPPTPPTRRVEPLDLASLCASSGGSSSTRTHLGAPEEDSDSDQEEGRLPTPVLRTRPLQRTHHDITTPATGGALLVGRLRTEQASPLKRRCDSAACGAKGGGAAPPKEAWPETDSRRRSPDRPPAPKPLGSQQAPPSPAAPPPLHCIRGLLRHPDFQHNGELGLRLWEPRCVGDGDGCGWDGDGRLSAMSWRSAASCSAASAVLERAQRRGEDFWGKS